VFAVVVVLLTVLAGRLVQLQGIDASAYAAEGQKTRLRKVVLPAQRGEIVDRDGIALAVEQEARLVYADPSEVVDADGVAARLAPLLDKPAAELSPLLLKEKPDGEKSRYAVLARAVDPDLARRITGLGLPGIGAVPTTRRVYPNGALASATVGFVNSEGAGRGGIEYAYDEVLRGRAGELVAEQIGGRVISSAERTLRKPLAGHSVEVTLSRDIQWAAQQTLAEAVKDSAAAGGHIIVKDVSTGEILALATAPTFDPARPADAKAGTLSNTALSNVYEPGSVNKVITAAAALETGLLKPGSTVVVPPSITVADKTFREHGSSRPQHLTFSGVIAMSSNVGTIGIAQRLGKRTVYHYMRKFGLGAKTGLGLPGESAGVLHPVAEWRGSQVGNIPIGQGVSATALQMLEVYAIVANGGVRVDPSIVRGTRDADGRFTAAPTPKRTRVISAKTAAELALMLEAVTGPGGTARRARIPGYRVAGKTGTARRVGDNGRYEPGKYVSSFIGFAPADKPRLVVEVVLDRPTRGYYAGAVATRPFTEIMSFALGALKVPPTGRPAPKQKLTAAETR
jgi:cell division protein FtsI (penicillin-binding protein 3)